MVLTSVVRRTRTCGPLFLMMLLLICKQSEAQFAKYSNEFLNIGAGARGMAMGNAQVASVTDGTAGYWNPAALADVRTSLNSTLCMLNILRALENMIMPVSHFH